MAVLSGQSEAAGVALPNSTKLTSAATVGSSFGNPTQGLLNAIAVSSIGFSNAAQSNLIASYLAFTIQGNYQDYLSSFARFFGVNARQDATKLYIQKADLLQLTALSNNTAESLLIALLLRVKDYESNSIISKIVTEVWRIEFIKINNLSIIRTILLVKLYILASFVNYELQNADTPITPNII